MKNKVKYLLIGVLAIIVIVVIFSATRDSNETIKIGAIYPLSGGLAMYGEPAQEVTQLAVDEINANGGINGKRVEVNFQDHQCSSKLAVSIFQQLSSAEDIDYFTSAACSGTVLGIAPQLDDKVWIGSTVTAPKITGVSPWFFRNYSSDKDSAKAFAEYILEGNYRSVGVIHEETDYAKGLKIALEEYLGGSGVNVVSEGFITGASDIRTQVAKIKAAEVDILFISVQTVTSGDLVLSELERHGYRPEMIVNENIMKSTDLMSRYTDLLDGAVSVDYVLEKTELMEDVLVEYKEKYRVDCPQVNICTTVYDNIYLLAEAIEEVGDDPEAVRQYLTEVNHSGTSGAISFNKNNDRENARYSLFVIKNGVPVTLED